MIRRTIKEGAALILTKREEPEPRDDVTLIEKPVVRISPEAEAMLASSNRAAKAAPPADTPLEGSIEARRSPMHLG